MLLGGENGKGNLHRFPFLFHLHLILIDSQVKWLKDYLSHD